MRSIKKVMYSVLMVLLMVPFAAAGVQDGVTYNKPLNQLKVASFSIVNGDYFRAGDLVQGKVYFENIDSIDREKTVIMLMSPEFQFYRRYGRFSFETDDGYNQQFQFVIPYGTAPGEYYIRASIISMGAIRVQYIPIRVI